MIKDNLKKNTKVLEQFQASKNREQSNILVWAGNVLMLSLQLISEEQEKVLFQVFD